MDKTSTSGVALFLFAHQDDEFGVFHAMRRELANHRRVCCIYLTDGKTQTVDSLVRNRESVSVLTQIGVCVTDIVFAGEILGVGDAMLPGKIVEVSRWLATWMQRMQPASIYVPAWEGGHHDHDALHAATVYAARLQNTTDIVRQYSLYNGYRCRGKLFRVMLPIYLNGSVIRDRIPYKSRFQFIKFCFSYPSQAKTWLGLIPFVALHYIVWGTQQTQKVDFARISQRPHPGTLYYERRGFYTWEKMESNVSQLVSQEK